MRDRALRVRTRFNGPTENLKEASSGPDVSECVMSPAHPSSNLRPLTHFSPLTCTSKLVHKVPVSVPVSDCPPVLSRFCSVTLCVNVLLYFLSFLTSIFFSSHQ